MRNIINIINKLSIWYNSDRVLAFRTFCASFLTNGRKWEKRWEKYEKED